MEHFVKSGSADKQRNGCVIVGIFQRRKPSAAAQSLDADGLIGSLMRRGDMDGELGQTLVLHRPEKLLCDRVILVGLGTPRDFNESAYKKAQEAAATALKATGSVEASNYLCELEVKGRDARWRVTQARLAMHRVYYRFDECRSKPPKHANKLLRCNFIVARRLELPEGERGLREAEATARAMRLAADLGNLPGNQCTPSILAERAQQMCKAHSRLSCKVLDKAALQKLGMGAFLSVAKGSREEPRLIAIEYRGAGKDEAPLALVGKGVTFDAGGISLKPAASMDEMKYDMCGGAATIATLQAAAELELPLNLVGVVPAAENLPGGAANKPGDIVTSFSGKTIEVLNTDAEGRLLLCDALAWTAQEYQPEFIVDMATLTGACIVALGHDVSAVLGNHEPLINRLKSAGDEVGDRAWQLPLFDEYDALLKSPFADVANIGAAGGGAGTITAAAFLQRFVKKQKWAHLDIAGTAWRSGANKCATGRPVPLLVRFLLDEAERRQRA